MFSLLRFIPYAASGVLVGVLAWFMHNAQSDKQEAVLQALDLALLNCQAAAANIAEDQKSDAEIDNSDLDTFDVPNSWMRGPN